MDTASARPNKAADGTDQRRFACAIGAKQSENLALSDRQIHPVERF